MDIKKELVEKLEKDCEVILNQKLPKALADNNDGTYRNLVKALDSNLELIEKCKNKKVILNEVPTDKYGEIYLEQSEMEEIHKITQTALGENYTVITTPTKMSLLDGNDKTIFIDNKNYTYNELIDIIKKDKSKQQVISGIYGIVFKNAINNTKIYNNNISSIVTNSKYITVNSCTFDTNLKIGDKGELNVKYLLTDIDNKEKEDLEFNYIVELVDISFVADNSSKNPRDTRYNFAILNKLN